MSFLGLHKWMGLFVAIIVAISFTSAPAYAKAATAKKSEKETSAQTTKKKSDSKKSSKKSKKAKPKKPKKVKLSEDDPKAFTKALLYDKQGVEYEIVESKKKKQTKKDSPKKKEEVEEVNTFDFSTILPPITHEALIGSPYGIRSHRLHRGVDVNVIKDEPVVAAYPAKSPCRVTTRAVTVTTY